VTNHDDRIVNLVRAAGFRSATTSVNGVLRLGADPLRIPRLGIAQRHALDGFALNLERDRLFSLGRPHSRPRLLLVGPPPDAPGGISTCVRSILDSAIGVEFEIFHLSPTGAHGFHQPRILALLRLLRALLVLPVQLLGRRPAIVQVHAAYGNDFWRNAPFVLSCWASRIPSVLIIHGSRFDRAYQEAGALQRAAIKAVLRRPAAIFVRGEYWRQVLHSIAPGLPVHLLPTTTDPVKEPSSEPASEGRTVLFVGGTAAVSDNVRKGLPDLLAIVPKLVSEVPGVTLRLVGPEPGGPWKELLANDAAGHVEFMGSLSRERIGDLYRSAAVFVLPSHAEGMPNAIVEAMAHGLPIVASSVGSIPEVVEHGVGGYLLPPGDAQGLVTALAKVLKDPRRSHEMGEHNRRLVRARFTNRHTVERLRAVYSRLRQP
jgi:glycosyltransferase involved in cell wall biosynthesis